MTTRGALRTAVVPALWPAFVMAALLVVTRNVAGASLAAIAIQAVTAGLIYLAVFLMLAIGREQRQWYISKARQLIRRPRASAAVLELEQL